MGATGVLTLLTGFGILDVRHGFGAQGPDGDTQLLKRGNMETNDTTSASH